MDKRRGQRGQSSHDAMSRQNSFATQPFLPPQSNKSRGTEAVTAVDIARAFASSPIVNFIAACVLICALSNVAIAVNLWIGASGVTSTVVRANELLDEARETGILPLVKASKANVTALLTNTLAASVSVQQLADGVADVNITDVIVRAQDTARRILAIVDSFVAERRVSINLP